MSKSEHHTLLFSHKHLELLTHLYRCSVRDFQSVPDIYRKCTNVLARGINSQRVSYWQLKRTRLVCLDLFDAATGTHGQDQDLIASELPHYFAALRGGIALIANDVYTHEATMELAQTYLRPRNISAMLDVPVREDGKLSGVLCCERLGDAPHWSESDLAFARVVADVMSLLLEQFDHQKTETQYEQLYEVAARLNEKLLDFTYIVSHNIRSNTSNIAMILDLIDEAESEAEKSAYFKLLRETSNKLSETIHYLNETINIQLGSKETRVWLKVLPAITKLLSGINAILQKEHAQIDLDIDEKLEIETIPSYFESVIFNLITNAVKYRDPNRAPHISIRAFQQDDRVHVEVQDNGLGIDLSRHKNKLFGMYKTFHGNKDAVGLGLFMTRNHVEALGGSITVESQPGKGSCFKIVL